MRTREKYDDLIWGPRGNPNYDAYQYHSPPLITDPDHNGDFPGDPPIVQEYGMQQIIDDTTPSKITKAVTHKKRHIKRFNIDSYRETQLSTGNLFILAGPNAHWHSWGEYGDVYVDDLYTTYSKTVNQLKAEAMHKFFSVNEVDNLQNIVESGQLVSGAKDLFRIAKLIPSKRLNQLRFIDISNQYLAYSFGVSPLVRDMNKINASIRALKSKMDLYVRNYTKPYTASVINIGTIAYGGTADGYSANANNDDSSWWHLGLYPDALPTLRVGVRGRRKVADGTSDSYKKLDYLISRFLATGPASLAWELTRYSFVVDWFVNLTGIIDALDNALTGSAAHIEDAWMSESWSVLAAVIKHKYHNWASDWDGKQSALNTLSYYHREPISTTLTVAPSGRFGKKQASLAGALLHQIVANLKRG